MSAYSRCVVKEQDLPQKMTADSVKILESQHLLRVFIFIGYNFAEQKSNRKYGKVISINTSVYNNLIINGPGYYRQDR